jgi:hypothetical protein
MGVTRNETKSTAAIGRETVTTGMGNGETIGTETVIGTERVLVGKMIRTGTGLGKRRRTQR